MSSEASEFERAEQTYLSSLGLEPAFSRLELDRVGCSVRVGETGDGPPVLFVHGGVTGGLSWADLAVMLPDFRCIMLDRPGCGLSESLPAVPATLAAQQQLGDDLVVDVLDALGLSSANVVSNSLGGWFTFRGAAAHPERIDRIVAMGFQIGARMATAPWFMRVQPPKWLAGRIRVNKAIVRRMLSAAGLRGVIESGKFGDEALDVMIALINHTDTMRNELLTAPRPMGLRGWNDEVIHTDELLARVTAPTHLFWGADDPFGGEDAATELANSLPAATVEMVPSAGHAPWIDELERAADAVRSHLMSSVSS